MPFDGAGKFNRVYSWAQDALNGLFISSSRMDTEMNGMATGLSNCLTRDGQSPPTADIPMNGFKLTGLAPGVAATDAATVGQATATNIGSIYALGNSGAAFNLDPTNGHLQYVTLNASSVCTLINPTVVTNTGWYYMQVTNNGGFSLGFTGAAYSSGRWFDHGAAPTARLDAGSITWFAFFWDGTAWYNQLLGLPGRRKNYFVWAYRNGSAQSTPANSLTKIQFNAVGLDPYSEFDAVTNFRWMPKYPGVYSIVLNVQATNASAGYFGLQIAGNSVGTYASMDIRAIAAATNQLISLASTVEVAQSGVSNGYYLEFMFQSSTGAGSIIQGSGATTVMINRIGDVE